jgi:hypothetical protein
LRDQNDTWCDVAEKWVVPDDTGCRATEEEIREAMWLEKELIKVSIRRIRFLRHELKTRK